MKFLIVTIMLAGFAMGQNLPDAPSSVDRSPAEIHYSQAHHWDTLWDGRPSRTSKEVFTMKTYWTFVGADLAASTFDASMSYAYQGGACVEGGEGLGQRPSFSALMRNNLPENAAVAVVGWAWLKARGPRWLMPAMLAYPIQSHLRAGLAWRHC